MNRRTATPTAAVLAAALLAAAAAGAADAPADTSLTLRGEEQGTVLRSLTVEGENRLRIEFARPELVVDLDPASAPGLSWGSPRDVLDRTVPDLVGPYLASSAQVRSPYAPRPWLAAFAHGPVATFAADVEGVERWTLLVVDSRGAEVIQFAGEGKPPRRLPWDGLDAAGEPAAPGLTYSFVFESWDEAGNKRRFTGDGFGLPAYRLEGEEGPCFLLAGETWHEAVRAAGVRPPALALEAASRLNLACGADAPLEVRAAARTPGAAEELGRAVAANLAPLVPGGHTRLVVRAVAEEGAPPAGWLAIGPARTPVSAARD